MKSRLLATIAFGFLVSSASAEVRLERIPERGMQSQIATGGDGTLHLVYLTGDARAADVRYATQKPGSREWSAPVTVNSEAGRAIAIDTIRGAQIATGQNDRVHVVWNGRGGKNMQAALLYSRGAASNTRPCRPGP